MTQSSITTVGDNKGSPDVPDDFRIHDAQTANWVVRKITEARHYADRVQAWAAAEVRLAVREEQFFLARFGRDLEEWCLTELGKRGPRTRSVNLPAARVGFRRSRLILQVSNPADALAWCRKNLPDAIAIIERVAKAPLIEFFEQTGEVPGGITIKLPAERFYIGRSASTETTDRADSVEQIDHPSARL